MFVSPVRRPDFNALFLLTARDFLLQDFEAACVDLGVTRDVGRLITEIDPGTLSSLEYAWDIPLCTASHGANMAFWKKVVESLHHQAPHLSVLARIQSQLRAGPSRTA